MAACLPFTPWRPVIYHDSRPSNQTLTLLQQTCVYLVIAYLLTRTRIFIPLMHVTIRLPHRATCYIVFSLFCILGTYLGLKIDDSVASLAPSGRCSAGDAGWAIGWATVGFTGGLHRYSPGGPSPLRAWYRRLPKADRRTVSLLHDAARPRDTLFNPLPGRAGNLLRRSC